MQPLKTERQSCHQALRLLLTETQHTSKREKKGYEVQEDFVAQRVFPDALQPKWPCQTRHNWRLHAGEGMSCLGHLNSPLDRWRAEGEPAGGHAEHRHTAAPGLLQRSDPGLSHHTAAAPPAAAATSSPGSAGAPKQRRRIKEAKRRRRARGRGERLRFVLRPRRPRGAAGGAGMTAAPLPSPCQPPFRGREPEPWRGRRRPSRRATSGCQGDGEGGQQSVTPIQLQVPGLAARSVPRLQKPGLAASPGAPGRE